jgi:hypothetical protein
LCEVLDGALDQAGAVVHRHDLDALGQAGLQRLQLGFDGLDGFQRVLARAHDDHAAGRFALAVQFADAAPHLRPDLDARHVAQAHRDARRRGHERNLRKSSSDCR